MTDNRPSISAFFPAYNDVGSIGQIIHTMAWLLPRLSDNYEVVVVDDGSSDGTADLLRKLSQEYRFLKVIHHGVNRGYGAALITGFANCCKDLIFYTDGDGQYNVEELPVLLDAFGPRTDVVTGYKLSRSDPRHRIVVGFVYRHVMRFLFRLQVKDVDCDFRLFRRSIFDRIQLVCDSGVICVEMMKKFQMLGGRIVEVPAHHYPRCCGRSQFFRFKHLKRVFVQLFSLWCHLILRPRALRQPAMGTLPVRVR